MRLVLFRALAFSLPLNCVQTPRLTHYMRSKCFVNTSFDLILVRFCRFIRNGSPAQDMTQCADHRQLRGNRSSDSTGGGRVPFRRAVGRAAFGVLETDVQKRVTPAAAARHV